MILPETLLQDLRYGVRMLFSNAGFAAVSVLALALGIGVNAATFTAYRALVRRSLDARDPGRMVNLTLILQSGAESSRFSYPDYEAYRDHVHACTGFIAMLNDRVTLADAGGIVSARTASAESLLENWEYCLRPPTTPNSPAPSWFRKTIFQFSEWLLCAGAVLNPYLFPNWRLRLRL